MEAIVNGAIVGFAVLSFVAAYQSVQETYVRPYEQGRVRSMSAQVGYANPEQVKKVNRYGGHVEGIVLELEDGTKLCYQAYSLNQPQPYLLVKEFRKGDTHVTKSCTP